MKWINAKRVREEKKVTAATIIQIAYRRYLRSKLDQKRKSIFNNSANVTIGATLSLATGVNVKAVEITLPVMESVEFKTHEDATTRTPSQTALPQSPAALSANQVALLVF
jgi:hypothetical protein